MPTRKPLSRILPHLRSLLNIFKWLFLTLTGSKILSVLYSKIKKSFNLFTPFNSFEIYKFKSRFVQWCIAHLCNVLSAFEHVLYVSCHFTFENPSIHSQTPGGKLYSPLSLIQRLVLSGLSYCLASSPIPLFSMWSVLQLLYLYVINCYLDYFF